MVAASRFETLTRRNALIQERTTRLISDLRRLVQMLEDDIRIEEERTGIFDPMNPDYSVAARHLRARRDNLTATISRLEKMPAAGIRYTAKRSAASIPSRSLPAKILPTPG
jgi:hypothetical protein